VFNILSKRGSSGYGESRVYKIKGKLSSQSGRDQFDLMGQRYSIKEEEKGGTQFKGWKMKLIMVI